MLWVLKRTVSIRKKSYQLAFFYNFMLIFYHNLSVNNIGADVFIRFNTVSMFIA